MHIRQEGNCGSEQEGGGYGVLGGGVATLLQQGRGLSDGSSWQSRLGSAPEISAPEFMVDFRL